MAHTHTPDVLDPQQLPGHPKHQTASVHDPKFETLNPGPETSYT